VDTYLLITLLSFALSVSLIRLFLALTRYPQLDGSPLHIAHVLWGGLLLFVAAMLPLILANRWVYTLTSVLAGVGVGLFIDEVGKFITQHNDYFYPPAAPIIYAFFLICVLVYLQLSRPPARQARTELYTSLEMMEDVLDHDLDTQEREEIEARLRYVVAQKDHPELSRLAGELLDYFNGERIYIAPAPPDYLQKLEVWLHVQEARYLSRDRFRITLAIGLAALGSFATITSIRSIVANLQPVPFEATLTLTIGEANYAYTFWFFALQIVQGLLGLLLVVAGALLLRGRERQGLAFAFYGLLVYLVMVDLLLFYYYQFATILMAIVQFMLLIAVLNYRQRYLTPRSGDGAPVS
jgi:hypothetical protein